MKSPAFYCLFEDVWEYLDFKRHKREISRTSPEGRLTATLKNEGFFLTYTLTAREEDKISVTLQCFRSTARRLREFHLGCAKIARDMKRFLRTGDREWLKADRPFGSLHGGIVLPNGGTTWRGDKDDIDPDEWLDLVEDEELARLLCRVDALTDGSSRQPDGEKRMGKAWELMEIVPSRHEFHVEVLRRRMSTFVFTDRNFKDLPRSLRWARALVEAETWNVTNWWWLENVVERMDGKPAAVRILQEALRRHGPDHTLHYSLSAHLCALGRLDEAREAMLLALKEDPCALESSLESEIFIPIRDFIREQRESDWYLAITERWKSHSLSEEINP